MDGEQTTQTAEATQATGATQASGSHGAVPGGNRQQFAAIPDLGPGKENDSQWVMYLQELLNFYYQMQVVDQNGHFDHQTENAVSHFRDFMNLGAGHDVTREVWQALGAEAPAGSNASSSSSSSSSGGSGGTGGAVQERDHQVQLVELQGEASWAASAAMVLNAKAGGSYNTESLCQRVNASTSDRKGWQDLVNLATSDLGMRAISCHGGTAAGWSEALQDTPLCMPNPGDEYNIVVVAGVRADGHLHVLDPKYNFDSWMTWADFAAHYGINDGYNAELLGV